MNILAQNGAFFASQQPPIEARFSLPANWSLPSWSRIKREYPRMAQRMLEEYHRLGGFIPFDPGFVYLIHAEGSNYYKIGKTTKPERRLLQISPKMPFKTRFVKIWRSLFMSEAETFLHRAYSQRRTNGEWFELESGELYNILRSNVSNEIQYAYAVKWRNVMIGNLYDPADNEERCRWRKDALPMDESLIVFDVCTPSDVYEMGGMAYMFLSYVEYYFDAITRDLDKGLPIDIQDLLNAEEA